MSSANASGAGGNAPPAPVVRRGRGTFKHQLRTEELERQSAAAYGRAEEASTIVTAATATVVLPSSTLGTKAKGPITEEDEIAAEFAHLKKGKDIPLTAVPVMSAAAAASILAPASDATATRERLIAAAIAAAEARANAPRTQFGLFENNTNDTARQLLFRNEKRRRYCVIIGDLQNQTRQVTLKLFGHKGEKPFKLQNKLIRLVNLSIGKPRRGTTQDLAARGLLDADGQPLADMDEEGEEREGQGGDDASDAVSDGSNREAVEEEDEDDNPPLSPTAAAREEPSTAAAAAAALASAGASQPASGSTAAAEQRALQQQTHAAAGFDVEEPAAPNAFSHEDTEAIRLAAEAAEAVPLPVSDSEQRSSRSPTPAAAAAAAPPALSTDDLRGRQESNAATYVDAAAAVSSPPQRPGTVAARSPQHPSKEAEGEDVDHYLDEDEVVPLTVQQAGTSTSIMYENSIANSPVLTARRFSALRDYFLREFRFLLSLEDVRTQNVSVKINLGAAYCCLARQGSYSTPLKHATFGEFVERMNTESMQLYFINDCPACVSRAVDMESGSLNFPATSTTVKINFFSNERQSRSIARAVWDSDEDQFRLLDVENIGVTFNWSVFSLDESFVRRKGELQAEAAAAGSGSAGPSPMAQPPAPAAVPPPPQYRSPAAGAAARARMGPAPVGIGVDMNYPVATPSSEPPPALDAPPAPLGAGLEDSAPSSAAATSPHKSGATAGAAPAPEDDEDDLARNKTVAYPFEVEFRAYRRWKQQSDNPAAPLAKAILEELSLAEHNYLSHGSSAAYERLDLTNVCEVDFAADDLTVESIVVEHTSRVKPEGTDLLVDNTTSLFIENFAAARQLKEKVRSYGRLKVAAMQNPSNNNYMRALWAQRRAQGISGGGGRDGLRLSPDEMEEVLKPTSKLTFFRSRGSTIHWKLRPNCSLEENIAPMSEALSFLQQVLHTANDIERTSARGGAAPNAL